MNEHRGVAALVLIAVLLVGLFVGGAAVLSARNEQVAETTAQDVSSDLDRVCQLDPLAAQRADADCGQAAQVARDGVDGALGPAGRGIVGTRLVDGRLVITFSDGASTDVGQVVGADGLPGPDGRGITDTAVLGGQLVVTYTDGATAELGQVVGENGRGIASVDGSTGRLLVTLTDGTVLDAGPLPPGPQGAQGDRGDPGVVPSVQSVTRTYNDGSVERCTRTGGPDTDPELACEVTPAPNPEPDDGGGGLLGG